MKKGHGYKNNHGGGSQPKTGTHKTPICRYDGYMNTMGAMESKTKSGYSHMGKHNQYESAMVDDGANVYGYMPE